jgi:hypothetical protein
LIVFLAGVKVEFMTNSVTIDQFGESVNLACGAPAILILGFPPNDFMNQVGCPLQFQGTVLSSAILLGFADTKKMPGT